MSNDMRAVIVPKSDQLNADDLLAGPITITVERVSIRPGTEQPCSIHYAGDNGKPYKPCKSMARAMVSCWGADANNYVGRSMTLYCDPKVTWAGMAVGGIRISHMSHIADTATLMLTATKGSRKPFVVQPLKGTSGTAAQNQPQSQAPQIDAQKLLADAEAAADKGNDALTEHLRLLTRAAKDALRPHGDDLRARAAKVGQPSDNAQAAPGASTAAPSDDDMVYSMVIPTGETITFENERAYLVKYREIVTELFQPNRARDMLAFDNGNRALIASVVGLKEAVDAVDAEIRPRPAAGGLNV